MTEVLDAPAEPQSRRSKRWWIWLSIAVLVVGLAIAAFVGNWLTDPKTLNVFGNKVTMDLHAGRTATFDAGVYASHNWGAKHRTSATITITGVSPVIAKNTADADITLLICQSIPGNIRMGSVKTPNLSPYCSTTTSINEESSFQYSDSTSQVLVQITPRSPGTVRIRGFAVTYRDGIRWGSQHSGMEIVIHAQDVSSQ